MSSALIVPKRLFLDTRDLINLSHLQRRQPLRHDPSGKLTESYKQILAWMIDGSISVVVSTQAFYEWFKGGTTAAYEIADVLDCAKTVLCIEGDTHSMLLEVLNECKRISPSLPFEPWRMVRRFQEPDTSMPFLSRYFFPQFAPERATPVDWVPVFSSVRQRLQIFSRKLASPSWPRNLDKSFAATLKKSHDGLPRSPNLNITDKVGWFNNGLLLAKILDHFVGPSERDSLFAEVDLNRCPGANLFLRTYWQYARANPEARPHDEFDILFVPVLAYADAVLVEKRLRGYLESASKGIATSPYFCATAEDALVFMG